MPTNRTAATEPLLIAETSAYTMSQATASLERATLSAGFGDLKERLRTVLEGSRAYSVVCSNGFLIISGEIQPQKG
jgi:hypothetical protein